jgi:hypothetical protein
MTLIEKQKLFPRLLAKLIEHVYANGYELTLGEVWRSDATAALNAKLGKGIKNSLHIRRLAVDINLFKNGVWLKDTKDYKWLGTWWKALGGAAFETAWGGDFSKLPDGCHFSIADGGQK